jgi:hypothetical protein
MITQSNYTELKNAQIAIENLHATKPTIYKKFTNIVKLTRQLHCGYQYMGTVIMDENTSDFYPKSLDDYVMSVYHREIEKLKTDEKFSELKQVLNKYKQVTYVNISKLALGENPKELVGPILIH